MVARLVLKGDEKVDWSIFLIPVLQGTQSWEFQDCSLSLQGSFNCFLLWREGPFWRTSSEPPVPL